MADPIEKDEALFTEVRATAPRDRTGDQKRCMDQALALKADGFIDWVKATFLPAEVVEKEHIKNQARVYGQCFRNTASYGPQ